MDNLPHSPDLSPWGMYLNADPVVKGVLIGLVFASVVTWTVWLAKSLELLFAKRRVRVALELIFRQPTLEKANGVLPGANPVAHLTSAALAEQDASAGIADVSGIKERIALRLERIVAAHSRRIAIGTGLLASIGATAPFVGLFGTVWGIMNSFIGIAKHHTTNLAVVAPGIAEALLTTAVGLAAAIPAVLIYNVFSRSIAGYRALLGDAGAEVMRLAGRDLDRRRIPSPKSMAAE